MYGFQRFVKKKRDIKRCSICLGIFGDVLNAKNM